VKLLPGGALLDGRAIEPRWEPDGKTLLVDIAEPGQHRLELLIEPTTQAGDAFTGFSLATARLPLARLELSVPADAGKIEVPSALGSVTTEADPPRVVADLGPSDRLTVRWQGAAGRAPGAPPADVEQLLWLKVQPGAVVLDACLKLKAAEGRVRQLRLVTDPRLRLLPLQGPDPPTADVQSLPGQPQSIRLEFPQPIADQTVLRLSFLVTGSTGVGNLGLPRIELPDARTTLRWVAVWLDPSLRGEPHPGAAETLAPPTFAAAWGPSDLQPAMAFSLPSAETAWSIATQPQPADTTAEQVQTCLAAPGSVQVDFRARLITAVGYQFQYRVLAPKQFEVDEVSLQEQSADCLARWSRDPSGAVVLMLTRRLSGPQQLSIRGRFPVANRATIALPLLGVEGATVSSHTIGVFREPGVRVQYTPAGGLTEFEPGKAEEDLAPGGQLVAWLRADPSQPIRAELLVSANRPQVTVRQLTSVRRVGNRWQAGVDCRAHVESGVVEEFRFRTDPSWKGPYQVTPADSLQVMEKPGGGHELLLRPRAPVEGDYRFTVWGPLTADSSGRVQVPAIELQQATVLEHWLALPAQEAGRALRWDTENLRQGPLPGAWVNPGEKPQTIAAYQVVGDQPFQAVLEPAQGPPQVRLADIRMEWRPDDTFRGVATLEVYAAGEPHAVLQLPPGAQLVSVHLGGIAIKPTLERGNLWDVPMLPVSCPQFLDVVFAGTLPDSSSLGGGYALEAPSLVGLPVRESLWVVDCHSEDVYAATDGVQPVDPFQCAMIRLRGLAGAIKTVVDSPVHDAEGKLPCYRNLVRRWAAARNEVQQALSGNPRAATQAVQSAAAEFEALDREQSQLAERLGASDLLTQATAVGTPAGEPAEAWSRSLPPSGATACFVDSRGRSRIVLRTGRVEASPGLLDWLAGAAVIGLTCLAVWVLRRGAVPKAWRPSPQAVGIVAGLAWWLWFWPGVLGLAVALSCLIVWLYPALRRRRQDGSGVVPIRARPPR